MLRAFSPSINLQYGHTKAKPAIFPSTRIRYGYRPSYVSFPNFNPRIRTKNETTSSAAAPAHAVTSA